MRGTAFSMKEVSMISFELKSMKDKSRSYWLIISIKFLFTVRRQW